MKLTYTAIERECVALQDDPKQLKAWVLENVAEVAFLWRQSEERIAEAFADLDRRIEERGAHPVAIVNAIRNANRDAKEKAKPAELVAKRLDATRAADDVARAIADGTLDRETLLTLARTARTDLLHFQGSETDFYATLDPIRRILTLRRDARVAVTSEAVVVQWGARGRMTLRTCAPDRRDKRTTTTVAIPIARKKVA